MARLMRLAMAAIELAIEASFAVLVWFLDTDQAIGWRLVLTALAFVIARYTAGGIGMVLLIGTTRRAQARGFDMTSELRIVLTAKAGAIAGLILGSLAGYCAAGPMLMLAGAALLSLCGSVLGTRMGGIWSGRVLISDLGSGRKSEYIVNGQPGIPTMSKVVFATDLSRGGLRGTPVVLKTYSGTGKEARDDFVTEAHIWMNLGVHPHIARAEFIEEVDDRQYLVIEYVEPDDEDRNTIAQFLGGEPLPLSTALRWAIQICAAMRYAFEQRGLQAHGDLKPPNVLVTRQSNVKVTDFGLSRANAAGVTTGAPERRRQAFAGDAPGPFVGADTGGTVGWMAPERFVGVADQRSDIYSFGIILWQTITGAADSPFSANKDGSGRDWDSARNRHLTLQLPTVASPLWPVVRSCVRKQPEDRVQTFAELMTMLDEIAKAAKISYVVEPTPTEEPGYYHYNRGLSFRRLERYEEAVKCFDLAVASLKTDPDRADAQLRRASCLTDLGDFDGAIKECDDVVRRLPKYWMGYLERSMVWQMMMDMDKAEADAKAAVKHAPLSQLAKSHLNMVTSVRKRDRPPREPRGRQGEPPPRMALDRTMVEGLDLMEAMLTDPGLFPPGGAPGTPGEDAERQAHLQRILAFRDALKSGQGPEHVDRAMRGIAAGPLLMAAAFEGNLDKLKAQIAMGASLNAHHKDGFTPLMAASVRGHIDCVQALIAAGANLEERENTGKTVLFIAAAARGVAIIKLLGAAGIDANAIDSSGMTALFYAVFGDSPEIVKALIDIGTSTETKGPNAITSLTLAIEQGHLDCVNALIAGRANVNARNSGGDTPLMAAARGGHATNDGGDTALMHAAYFGHVECVKALVAAGSDRGVKNRQGYTALSIAQAQRHADCVRALA